MADGYGGNGAFRETLFRIIALFCWPTSGASLVVGDPLASMGTAWVGGNIALR